MQIYSTVQTLQYPIAVGFNYIAAFLITSISELYEEFPDSQTVIRYYRSLQEANEAIEEHISEFA
jgi:hypothetical protein